MCNCFGCCKGDTGDRGRRGQQGIQGEQGIQGIKGDKGDKGDSPESAYLICRTNNVNKIDMKRGVQFKLPFKQDADSKNISYNATNNEIVCDLDGKYLLSYSIFADIENNEETNYALNCSIYKNSKSITDCGCNRKLNLKHIHMYNSKMLSLVKGDKITLEFITWADAMAEFYHNECLISINRIDN